MESESRVEAIASLIEQSQQAFASSTRRPESALPVAGQVFRALENHGRINTAQPQTLPVCKHLAVALAIAKDGPEPVAALARTFEALTPQLSWYRRPGAREVGGDFFDGHANTMFVGPRGLERRHDVMIGASLVAPGVRYVDHHHPPEEFYVVLSSGQWRQETLPWHEPGPGGVVHNPPNIVHAMRAGDSPLLALWFLWIGQD